MGVRERGQGENVYVKGKDKMMVETGRQKDTET